MADNGTCRACHADYENQSRQADCRREQADERERRLGRLRNETEEFARKRAKSVVESHPDTVQYQAGSISANYDQIGRFLQRVESAPENTNPLALLCELIPTVRESQAVIDARSRCRLLEDELSHIEEAKSSLGVILRGELPNG